MRYAVYFTPPSGDALLKVAANWLGRSAFSGEAVKTPSIRGLEASEIAELTAEPRRYGFHATMKPPFRLADGVEEAELLSALMHFASSADTLVIPKLELSRIGSFFALTLEEPVAPLQQLANDVVVALDRFRAAPNEAEIARRRPESLSDAQRRNLEKWGYPYVFEEFRFHMTLTGRVTEKEQPRIERILDEFFAPVLAEPVEVGNLALFVEPEPGAAFEVHSLHPLTGQVLKDKNRSRQDR